MGETTRERVAPLFLTALGQLSVSPEFLADGREASSLAKDLASPLNLNIVLRSESGFFPISIYSS